MTMQTESEFQVEIRQVSVPSRRLIQTTPERVEEMKRSLEQDGQLMPILIRVADHNSYRVVAGATRFKAAKALGWSHISAKFVHGTIGEIALAEVVENKSRNNLSVEEQRLLRDEEIRLRLEIQKEMEVRAAQARRHEQAPKSHKARSPEEPRGKPGRPKGGVRQVARDMGVSDRTARRAVNGGEVTRQSAAKSPPRRSARATDPIDRAIDLVRSMTEDQQETFINRLYDLKVIQSWHIWRLGLIDGQIETAADVSDCVRP